MAEVPDDIHAACQQFRQGDILEGALLIEVVATERPLGSGFIKSVAELKAKVEAEGKTLPPQQPVSSGALYSCIVSQTCDIVQNNKRSVTIAPVAPLGDPNDPALAGESKTKQERRANRELAIETAKNSRQPHIIYFPPFGDDRFPVGGIVDLKAPTTIQKPILAGLTPARFIGTEPERRDFSFRCAHIFDRPAIPQVFVDHVTGPLRDFLISLDKEDDPRLAVLRAAIGDEWLAFDDSENPHVATLYFLGDTEPSAAAKEILDEWWEPVSSNMPEGYSLLPNRYEPFERVNLKEARVMSLLTYWYLSDEK